jgi:hypothetical protein
VVIRGCFGTHRLIHTAYDDPRIGTGLQLMKVFICMNEANEASGLLILLSGTCNSSSSGSISKARMFVTLINLLEISLYEISMTSRTQKSSKKGDSRDQSTEWSKWEWDKGRQCWYSSRQNSNGEYEYEFRDPDTTGSESATTEPMPRYAPAIDSQLQLGGTQQANAQTYTSDSEFDKVPGERQGYTTPHKRASSSGYGLGSAAQQVPQLTCTYKPVSGAGNEFNEFGSGAQQFDQLPNAYLPVAGSGYGLHCRSNR